MQLTFLLFLLASSTLVVAQYHIFEYFGIDSPPQCTKGTSQYAIVYLLENGGDCSPSNSTSVTLTTCNGETAMTKTCEGTCGNVTSYCDPATNIQSAPCTTTGTLNYCATSPYVYSKVTVAGGTWNSLHECENGTDPRFFYMYNYLEFTDLTYNFTYLCSPDELKYLCQLVTEDRTPVLKIKLHPSLESARIPHFVNLHLPYPNFATYFEVRSVHKLARTSDCMTRRSLKKCAKSSTRSPNVWIKSSGSRIIFENNNKYGWEIIYAQS